MCLMFLRNIFTSPFPHSSQAWNLLSGWWYTLWSFCYLSFSTLLIDVNLIVQVVVHPMILQLLAFFHTPHRYEPYCPGGGTPYDPSATYLFSHSSQMWTLLSGWWYAMILQLPTFLHIPHRCEPYCLGGGTPYDPSATYLFPHSS